MRILHGDPDDDPTLHLLRQALRTAPTSPRPSLLLRARLPACPQAPVAAGQAPVRSRLPDGLLESEIADRLNTKGTRTDLGRDWTRATVRFDTSLTPDITVAVRLNETNQAPLDYYLLPRLDFGQGRSLNGGTDNAARGPGQRKAERPVQDQVEGQGQAGACGAARGLPCASGHAATCRVVLDAMCSRCIGVIPQISRKEISMA